MGQCIVRTRSGRCSNQALPNKRTCGQHPRRRAYQAIFTRKHSASEYLFREIHQTDTTTPTVEKWSTDDDRARWVCEAQDDGARLADEKSREFENYAASRKKEDLKWIAL